MLDKSFATEIRKANGGDSREARFALLREVRAAAAMLSTPSVMRTFGSVLRTYGRVPVALCVAATLHARRAELGNTSALQWADEVMSCWTNRSPHALDDAYIRDNLHCTRILEYAGSLIRLTSE